MWPLIIAAVQKRGNDALPQVSANSTNVRNGLAVIFAAFAAVTILVIVKASIDFATSDGNPENISKAKKTLIYAVVGLISAESAETIVLTVIGKI